MLLGEKDKAFTSLREGKYILRENLALLIVTGAYQVFSIIKICSENIPFTNNLIERGILVFNFLDLKKEAIVSDLDDYANISSNELHLAKDYRYLKRFVRNLKLRAKTTVMLGISSATIAFLTFILVGAFIIVTLFLIPAILMLALGIALLMLLLSVASEFGYNLGAMLQKTIDSLVENLNSISSHLPDPISKSVNGMTKDLKKVNLAGESHDSKTLLYPSTADGYQPVREENPQETRELNEVINDEEIVSLNEQVHDEQVDSSNDTS